MNKDKLPRTKRPIEEMEVNILQSIILKPLKTRSGINVDSYCPTSNLITYNRHLVLHGKDTNFPSEINSLKAISFLSYLGGFVYGIVSEAKKESSAN